MLCIWLWCTPCILMMISFFSLSFIQFWPFFEVLWIALNGSRLCHNQKRSTYMDIDSDVVCHRQTRGLLQPYMAKCPTHSNWITQARHTWFFWSLKPKAEGQWTTNMCTSRQTLAFWCKTTSKEHTFLHVSEPKQKQLSVKLPALLTDVAICMEEAMELRKSGWNDKMMFCKQKWQYTQWEELMVGALRARWTSAEVRLFSISWINWFINLFCFTLGTPHCFVWLVF